MAIINILLIIDAWPTITNAFANYELNYKEAFVAKNLFEIRGDDGGPEYITQKTNIEVQNMDEYLNVYKQNNRYNFKITPMDAYDLEIYCMANRQLNSYNIAKGSDKVTRYKIILLNTGHSYIFARVKPDFEVKPNQKYKGVFVPMTKMLKDTIKYSLGEGNYLTSVFTYELDTLNSFSYYHFTDLAFLVLPFVLLIFNGIRLLIYVIDYTKHPTYKTLEKMPNEPHENEELINLELADTNNLSISKNVYKTKGWIITKRFLKTKITRIAKATKFDE